MSTSSLHVRKREVKRQFKQYNGTEVGDSSSIS